MVGEGCRQSIKVEHVGGGLWGSIQVWLLPFLPVRQAQQEPVSDCLW